jgi:hypothetical protein
VVNRVVQNVLDGVLSIVFRETVNFNGEYFAVLPAGRVIKLLDVSLVVSRTAAMAVVSSGDTYCGGETPPLGFLLGLVT